MKTCPDGTHCQNEYLIEELQAELSALREQVKVDKTSWFYKNCKQQRKRGAKICQVCPFRKLIEQQES